VALRSMKAPGTAFDDPTLGKDTQPGTMKGYVHTTQDNGGVHTNSGIPNHAFYLLATALGGFAWEKAGQIWYDTLTDKSLKASANFAQFAILRQRMPAIGMVLPAPSAKPLSTPGHRSVSWLHRKLSPPSWKDAHPDAVNAASG
jgi:hypothetical protein